MTEADLHIHSHYSDGDCSIKELAKRVKYSGLKAAVLTDHDRIEGLPEFIRLCKENNIETTSGIEITSNYTIELTARLPIMLELHILGYGFDISKLQSLENEYGRLRYNTRQRNISIEKTISLYRGEFITSYQCEFMISSQAIIEMFKIPHDILQNKYWLQRARAFDLIGKKSGMNFRDAFSKAKEEIYPGGRFYVRKENYIDTANAISLIKTAGGIAVWAHPSKTLTEIQDIFPEREAKFIIEYILSDLKGYGLFGIEVYTAHNITEGKHIDFFTETCNKHGLCPDFGGTDYHGGKENEHKAGESLGDGGVSLTQFQKIKK